MSGGIKGIYSSSARRHWQHTRRNARRHPPASLRRRRWLYIKPNTKMSLPLPYLLLFYLQALRPPTKGYLKRYDGKYKKLSLISIWLFGLTFPFVGIANAFYFFIITLFISSIWLLYKAMDINRQRG